MIFEASKENESLLESLRELAKKHSIPFCMTCYGSRPTGYCKTCGHDDMARMTSNGCDFGFDWVIEEVIENSLEKIDIELEYEEYLNRKYRVVRMECCEFEPSEVLKANSPGTFSYYSEQHGRHLVDSGAAVEFNCGHYWVDDIRILLSKAEVKLCS